MSIYHLFLVLLVVAIWGTNFVFIRMGLDGFPPLLLCALRFFFAAIPAVFFLPRPKCSWRLLIFFGLALFAFQFSFLFTGMQLGMSPGMASLLMQSQVFFTIFLAAVFYGDHPGSWKIIGATISFFGIGIVAFNAKGDISLLGLVFTLCAAFSWAVGNILTKKIITKNFFALIVWGSLIATPFLFLISFIMYGSEKIYAAISATTVLSAFAIGYTVYLSTHLAYSIWSFLMQKYRASIVAPFTLLVPIFGFISSHIFLGEPFPMWKLLSAFFIILGLAFNFLEPYIKRLFKKI